LGDEMYRLSSGGSQAKRKTKENLERDCGNDCQVHGLNRQDAMDCIRWRKQIRDDW